MLIFNIAEIVANIFILGLGICFWVLGIFSTEYFPYWEFTMLMMLALNLSLLWRVHRIEKKLDDA
jgi:membrane protein implicated in regulation of membrane protease activity